MKTLCPSNDNLIDQTIALWESRTRRDLSREDARQIVENVTGFFQILSEWSRAEISDPANDNNFWPCKASETEGEDIGHE